jgi:Raf kinase inhibitor-like YbhB/YbcL family protein
MPLAISSSAFSDGAPIPVKHSREGGNVSPPLSWTGVPPETRALAIIVDDPDAPGPFPFVHWVVYQIPADWKGLDEGLSANPAGGIRQGMNSFGATGYGGPAPPPGPPHRYQFHLHALDHALELPAGLDKKALLAAMEGHVLADAVLVGTFAEPSSPS